MRSLLLKTVIVLSIIVIIAQAVPPHSFVSVQRGDAFLTRFNPFLLWEMSPGTWKEDNIDLSINTLGLRGAEVGEKTGPRAVILGDSTFFGKGIKEEDLFLRKLEKAIPAEFVNAAVPDYSSLQSLNLLTMRLLDLKPDLLIIGSLWSDCAYALHPDSEAMQRWPIEGEYARLHLFALNSGLGRWLDWWLRTRPADSEYWKVGLKVSDSGFLRRVPLQQYAANLDQLCAIMKWAGAGCMFVMPAQRDDLRWPDDSTMWKPYREVMRAAAMRHHVPLVSLPEAFLATGKSAATLFLSATLPTPAGQAVMADAITTNLQGKNWPAEPIEITPPSKTPTYKDVFEDTQVQVKTRRELARGTGRFTGEVWSDIPAILQPSLLDGVSPLPLSTGMQVYLLQKGDGPPPVQEAGHDLYFYLHMVSWTTTGETILSTWNQRRLQRFDATMVQDQATADIWKMLQTLSTGSRFQLHVPDDITIPKINDGKTNEVPTIIEAVLVKILSI